MDGYGPSTYGDRFADVYDDWYDDVSDVDATVERVAALAGPGGRVLELGAGSGRLAVPLAGRGLDVWAVDASSAMLDRLRARPGGDRGARRPRRHGPCSPTRPLGRGRRVRGRAVRVQHAVQPHRRRRRSARCLARVRRPAGARAACFVVEAFVPPPGSEGDAASRRGRAPPHRTRRGGPDRQPARPRDPHDHRAARADHRARGPAAPVGPPLRHARASSTSWPPASGLRLVERHAGWQGEPFTPGVRGPRLVLRPRASPTVTPRGDADAGRNVAHPAGAQAVR